eukprot:6488282-Amphidinium_carterae.2
MFSGICHMLVGKLFLVMNFPSEGSSSLFRKGHLEDASNTRGESKRVSSEPTPPSVPKQLEYVTLSKAREVWAPKVVTCSTKKSSLKDYDDVLALITHLSKQRDLRPAIGCVVSVNSGLNKEYVMSKKIS